MFRRFACYLSQPVHGGSLAVFRIAFGLAMAYESWHLLTWPNLHTNVLHILYSGPHVHWNFPYPGFEWIRPLSEPLLTAAAMLLGIAAISLVVGFWARLSAAIVCLLWTYFFLLEAAYYLNHYYLGCILAGLLATMPSAACYSFDRRNQTQRGLPASDAIPFWPVFLLRGQMAIVYFYAGLAKLNPDWLAGEPVRTWFTQRMHGQYLQQSLTPTWSQSLQGLLESEATIQLVCYGGLLFDLSAPILLLIPRTRLFALTLAIAFHVSNSLLFNIGAFPVMGIAATLLFLEPDWPAQLGRWIRRPTWLRPDLRWLIAGALLVPVVGATLGWRLGPTRTTQRDASPNIGSGAIQWLPALGCLLWLGLQCLLPLRPYLIPGPALWTDEGARFAWLMMLRHKEPGYLEFQIDDPNYISGGSPAIQTLISAPATDPLRTSYRDIDPRQIDWANLPPVIVVHEPFVGERILYNARSRQAPLSSPDAASIAAWWESRVGHAAQVLPAQSLDRSWPQIQADLQSGRLSARDPTTHAAAVATSHHWQRQLLAPDLDPDTAYRLTGKLHGNIERLLMAEPTLRASLYHSLAFAPPFPLQGGAATPQDFWIIHDSKLVDPRAQLILWRQKLPPWYEDPILVDLPSLSTVHLGALPQIIVLREQDGRERIIWNYASELHRQQMGPLRTFPYLQHAYAQHIADTWQNRFGRRPAVRLVSQAALNHRPLQPMIDSSVDLASQPLHILRPNSWILPLEPTAP
jgi:hypothetical protein